MPSRTAETLSLSSFKTDVYYFYRIFKRKPIIKASEITGIINLPLNAKVDYTFRIGDNLAATSSNTCSYAVYDFLKRIDSSLPYKIYQNNSSKLILRSASFGYSNFLKISLKEN